MYKHELETPAGAKAPSLRQAAGRQAEKTEAQQPAWSGPDPLRPVMARLGNSASANQQAAILNRATASQPARAPAVLLQLQRQYGNRHVQRVVALARQADGETKTTPEVDTAIQRARGGGQVLDTAARTQMESAFGTDFSGVRVHASPEADTLSRSLNARAFTTGQDIFFRQGTYRPGSSSGRALLAHELTHVVQQRGTQVQRQIQRQLTISQPGDRYEQEADRIAQTVMHQEQQVTPLEATSGGVQRQMEEEDEEV